MTMNTYARFVVPEGVQLPPAASGETMPIVSSDEAMREVHKTIEIIRDVMEQKASRSKADDFNKDDPRGKIGHTPYDWIVGTVPACGFAKAKLLGENPATTMYDGECRHECRTGYNNGCFIGYPLGSVLYVLQNGDFVHVDTSLAMVIPACQIRSYIEKTGCPWMFTKARRALLTQLMQAQDGNAQPYM